MIDTDSLFQSQPVSGMFNARKGQKRKLQLKGGGGWPGGGRHFSSGRMTRFSLHYLSLSCTYTQKSQQDAMDACNSDSFILLTDLLKSVSSKRRRKKNKKTRQSALPRHSFSLTWQYSLDSSSLTSSSLSLSLCLLFFSLGLSDVLGPLWNEIHSNKHAAPGNYSRITKMRFLEKYSRVFPA